MENIIKQTCQIFDIKPNFSSFGFMDDLTTHMRVIPHYTRGVYIIVDESTDQTVYVGKGQVADRIIQHRRKVNNRIKIMKKSYESWHNYFENYEKDVDKWKVYYIIGNRETEMSALEGVLIHKLQPIANDEVYIDMQVAKHRGQIQYEYGVHYLSRRF